MANAKTFAIEVDQLLAKTNAKLEQVFRQTVKAVHRRAIQRTPVVTGYLRSNWNLSVGTPNNAVNGPEQRRPAISADASTALAMRSQSVVDRLTINDTAYVSNGTSYGVQVEHGGSRNEPRYMLTQAVLEVVTILQAGRIPD